jgi:flagellar basal body-associated protein FliL
MAKETDNPFEEAKADDPAGPASGMKLVMRIGMMVAVLGVGAAGGYCLAGLFPGSPPADPNGQPVEDIPVEEEYPVSPDAGNEDFQYIHFQPIIANLNEPRLARYVRATVVLAVRANDLEAANLRIEKRKPELRSRLDSYLSGQTLEDVRGEKSKNRIRRDMLEICNELLWPNRRPLIDHVLFKEFTVQ